MISPQQIQHHQPLQVEPAGPLMAGAMGLLMTLLFAIWVVQQGLKVARGEEIERPF